MKKMLSNTRRSYIPLNEANLRPQRRPLPLLRLRLNLRPHVALVLHARLVLLVEVGNAVRVVLALEVLECGEVVAESGLRERGASQRLKTKRESVEDVDVEQRRRRQDPT